jgi:hypothetical protein
MGHDLIRALHLIPKGGWFGDMFGSTMLSGGLVARFGWSTGAATALRIALTVTAVGGGIALALRPRLRNALEQLTEGERMALLAGGLLIVSCYFTAQNIGYRCMHLILTLPALTALVRLKAGRLMLATTVTVLLLLWSQGWRNWIELLIPGRPTTMTLWFVREGLWWWTVSMLIGFVLALLMRSEMGRAVFRRPSASLSTAGVTHRA